jgi:hypothetical protein
LWKGNLKGENKMNKENWVSHLEWVVVFVTLIGGFYMIEARTICI